MSSNPETKTQYIIQILAALHLALDDFMYQVVHQQPYESTLYLWIDKLYTQGKTVPQAITLIYKARNRWMLSKNPNCITQKDRKHF